MKLAYTMQDTVLHVHWLISLYMQSGMQSRHTELYLRMWNSDICFHTI